MKNGRPLRQDVDAEVERLERSLSPTTAAGRAPLMATMVSLALHGALAAGAAWAVAHQLSERPPEPEIATTFPVPQDDQPLVVDLPPVGAFAEIAPTTTASAAPSSSVLPPQSPAPSAGGATVARVDTGAAGRGGDGVSERARNLAVRVDEETVTEHVRDTRDQDQDDRLMTGADRASQIDRRKAREPMELTFVASGKGFRYERRPAAAITADLGGRTGALPAAAGATHEASVSSPGIGDHLAKDEAGSRELGSSKPSPPRGAAYGKPKTEVGDITVVGAPIAKARPHVDKGKPSVAADRKGRPSDSRDADLAVADALASLVSTSTAGGDSEGAGRGGSGGGGAAGAGGSAGAGSKTAALADGNGDVDGPRNRQRTTYVSDLRKRLGTLVDKTFPVEAELDLRGGTVIVTLTIAPSGALRDVLVVRESGFPEFDRNVVRAIRGGGALPKVPDMLGPGDFVLRVPVHGGFRVE